MKTKPLQPFGVEVTVPTGTTWSTLDLPALVALGEEHRVVVVRGVAPQAPEQLARDCRDLGRLQPWRFGAVHELKHDPEADNYLYTDHPVPLHWDGAFADEVPHWLVFRCVRAPAAGGETTFVHTPRVLAAATHDQRPRRGATRVRYTTEKKAHYGGTFTEAVVGGHATEGTPVLRYAEPVDDLNPVSATPDGPDAHRLHAELRDVLCGPDVLLEHAWRDGDLVIADNHALLHGRRAYDASGPRHLLRVNILDPRPGWRAKLHASWRLRRPEFLEAEIPILAIPALLAAPDLAALATATMLDVFLLFFLWFHLGDLVNCLMDREVDVHRKTHLSEAVRTLGVRNVKAQIVATALASAAVAAHLVLALGRMDLAVLGVVGVGLAIQYTAPPIRMKSRGRWQIVAYMGLLFVFPMSFIEIAVAGHVSATGLLVSVAYAAMQSGILLVNNAEDLDEDEREGIYTASIALGARRAVRVGRAMAVGGGSALAIVLAATAGPWGLGALPLLMTTVATDRWLVRLQRRVDGAPEAEAREAIRAQGKHVPTRIESGAWAALFAAGVTFLLG